MPTIPIQSETEEARSLIVDALTLHHWLETEASQTMVFDCSFDLSQPQAGWESYTQAHIPRARYVHLDNDLCSHHAQRRASAGRHPLPLREDFAKWLSAVGFEPWMQAVVYDRNGGMFCGRMWWMLKWLGHKNVSVLDGGLAAWRQQGFATDTGPNGAMSPALPQGETTAAFPIGDALVELVQAQEIEAWLRSSDDASDQATLVLDARAAPRYRGEIEPIDPVAGHIPGAYNRPFTENFDSQGCYKSADLIKEELQTLCQTPGSSGQVRRIIHHCGSGVSAIPNIIAMLRVGWHNCALYAGSWSDWVSVRDRPVRHGSER